jgi:hypothetical protein
MARDELTKLIDGGASPGTDRGGQTDDTEGHSLALLLGLNAINEARQSDSEARAHRAADEALPSLTKKWPMMRPAKPAQTGAIDREPLGEAAGRAATGAPWRQGSTS